MSDLDLTRFAAVFAVPDFVIPHLDKFVSEAEVKLILCLGREKQTADEIAARLALNEGAAAELIALCYQRHLVNRETLGGGYVYGAGDFYALLDYLCKFDENYRLLEEELRKALDSWCYEVYSSKTRPYIEQLRQGEAVDRAPETYELIENLNEFIAMASEIRLVPCNCRKLAANCQKPTGTCLAFDSAITDRTAGKAVSGEEALEIVRQAHKSGLMHQVNSDWRTAGPLWICNCCSCCCYPSRLALELGSKGVFPLQQYVARHDTAACSNCGACAKRCQVKAFRQPGGPGTAVEFVREDCWGCGICVDGCPAGAIVMDKA